MATTSDLLVDAFGRIRDQVHSVASGLSNDDLAFRAERDANSIGWLLWHLTRIQDDHLADLAGTEQAWTAVGWADRFALPFEPAATGYGQSAEEVGQVRANAGELIGYYDSVHEQTVRYLAELRDEDLDEVIDDSWDPPVTRGIRLVSVLSDDLQHVGQAAFIRGLLDSRRR